MKDNEIRDFVSALTKVAEEYGQTQQLRERIRGIVFPFIEEARRTVSGQEAPTAEQVERAFLNQSAWTDNIGYAVNWEDFQHLIAKLFAAPIPATEQEKP